MTRLSKSLTVICIVALVFMLSACGGNKSPGGESAAQSPDGSEAASKSNSDSPAPELTMAFLSNVPNPPDLPLVQDELNKIIKKKINATVKLMPINGGDYQQKINLMLASGEKLDMFVTGIGLNYYVQASTGQLTPLGDLIDQYGQGLKDQVGQEYLDAAKASDGNIYAVPTMRSFTTQTGFIMRKDLVDKYNLDVNAVKQTADLEPLLKTIKENEPGVAPIVPEGPGQGAFGIGVDVLYDPLGDTIGVLPNYGQDLKVADLYETKEYADWVKRLRDWYLKGYILKDAATNKETAGNLIKAKRGFGNFIGVTIGSEVQASLAYGTPMDAAHIGKPFTASSYIMQIAWAIPKQSQYPEKAMAMLNLMYSDPEVVNLLDYGIEGKHYVKVSDNVIKFPDGLTPANHPYNFNLGWEFGNEFISYVMQGNDPDIWKKSRELNNSALHSKAMGFVVNVDPIKTEIAAVQNVMNQYKPGLETGSIDPDKYLPEFISKLKAAGIDKIVAEKQKQLDAWAAKNKQ